MKKDSNSRPPINSKTILKEDSISLIENDSIKLNKYNKQLKRWTRITALKNDFNDNYEKFDYPKFKWHKSFHDRYARNESDLLNKLNYIHRNPSKHGITTNWQNYPWSSLNPEFAEMIDELPAFAK